MANALSRLRQAHPVLANVALAMAAPLLLLLVLEGAFAVFDVAPSDEDPRRPGVLRTLMAPDFDAGSLHARFAELPEEGRVVCLGESTMAGTPFDYQFSLCELVADGLDPEAEVVNLAGQGMDSNHVRALADLVCAHPQTVVLVYSGHNEFLNLRHFRHVGIGRALSPVAEFLSGFRVYRAIRSLVASAPDRAADTSDAEVDDATVMARYRENLEHVADRCGARLVAMTTVANPAMRFPLPGQTLRTAAGRGLPLERPGAGGTWRQHFQAPPEVNAALVDLGARRGVLVVDSAAALGGLRAEDYWDHVHPTPEAHRRLAAGVVAALSTRGLARAGKASDDALPVEVLRWGALDRGLYNLQFDPALGAARLEAVLREPGYTQQQLAMAEMGLAIAAFLRNRDDEAKTWLARVDDRMARHSEEIEPRQLGCAPIGGPPPRRGPARDEPRCLPWRSRQLMTDAEHEALIRLADGRSPPVQGLLRSF